MRHQYRRVAIRTVAVNRWLKLSEVEYAPSDAPPCYTPHKWELVQRTTRPEGSVVDAVDVCVVVNKGDDGRFLLLISQYRAPIDAITIEFPAGLVDRGEGPVETAIRELKEETGYVADPRDVLGVSPLLAYDPGLSDGTFNFVRLEVNAARTENVTPQQELKDDEDVAVHVLPLDGKIILSLESLRVQLGADTVVDGKVYTFCCGLSMGLPNS